MDSRLAERSGTSGAGRMASKFERVGSILDMADRLDTTRTARPIDARPLIETAIGRGEDGKRPGTRESVGKARSLHCGNQGLKLAGRCGGCGTMPSPVYDRVSGVRDSAGSTCVVEAGQESGGCPRFPRRQATTDRRRRGGSLSLGFMALALLSNPVLHHLPGFENDGASFGN